MHGIYVKINYSLLTSNMRELFEKNTIAQLIRVLDEDSLL